MNLSVHPPLRDTSRLPRLAGAGERVAAAELVVLLALGAAAAALTACVDLDLRVPGHSILRAVFPIALGLALVPRRHAGLVAGAGALAGALAIGGWPGTLGPGALTSLVLTGPILDAALRRARSGRGVYAGLVLGGLASNLVAFGARLLPKLLGETGHRPLAAWWPPAIASYSLCGAAAGLLGAMVWFRMRDRDGSA